MKAVANTKFLEFMEECGVLRFGDFTLKSGRKSPYFINTGEYKDSEQMFRLGGFYAEMVHASGVEFDVLYGPAYKGIPLAVITGTRLLESGMNVGISFNRKEAKDHGDSKSILGYTPKNGDKIAIIEDVITAGTTVKETTELFRELGIDAEIAAMYISVDRAERGTGGISAAKQIEQDYGIKVYAIATAYDIIDYLEGENKGERADKMREYLKEYGV